MGIVLACFVLPAAAQGIDAAACRPLPVDSLELIDLTSEQIDELIRNRARARARRLRMRKQERAESATAPRHLMTICYGIAPLINEGDYIPWGSMNLDNPAYALLYGKYEDGCFGRRSGGALSLVYTYRFAARWEVGASVAYIRYFNTLRMPGTHLSRSLSEHQFFIMPLVRVLWVRRPELRVYSGLELGLQAEYRRGYFARSYASAVHFAAQCAYIGLQCGNRVFFSAEVGTGARGTFTVGIGWKIDAKKRDG